DIACHLARLHTSARAAVAAPHGAPLIPVKFSRFRPAILNPVAPGTRLQPHLSRLRAGCARREADEEEDRTARTCLGGAGLRFRHAGHCDLHGRPIWRVRVGLACRRNWLPLAVLRADRDELAGDLNAV